VCILEGVQNTTTCVPVSELSEQVGQCSLLHQYSLLLTISAREGELGWISLAVLDIWLLS
jgi:hypothetical protein